MLIDFLFELKKAGLPVSLREFLTLIEGLQRHVAWGSMDDFYYFARTALVKDESNLDRFDRVFGAYFKGVMSQAPDLRTAIPDEWLRRQAEKLLTDEEKKLIESLGGWDKLMETLRQRLEEQKGRHQGGSKWVGTAGTSPFGAYGYNPEGVRIGQHESRNRRAVGSPLSKSVADPKACANPNTMPPSICWRARSGLIKRPQSAIA